eukprot:EG_transcript_4718
MAGHESLALAVTRLTLLLSLVVATVLWMGCMDFVAVSVELLRRASRRTTDALAHRIRELMLQEAAGKLATLLGEGESAMLVQRALVQSSDLLCHDLRPSRFDVFGRYLIPYRSWNFFTLKGHSSLCSLSVTGAVYRDGSDAVATQVFSLSWFSMGSDTEHSFPGTVALYSSMLAMTPDERTTTLNVSRVDQVTAVPTLQLSSQILPSDHFTLPFAPNGWHPQLGFSPTTGQAQLTNCQWLRARNDTWVRVALSIGAGALGDMLRAQLRRSADDRLVLFFRELHGNMIAASHGTVHRHSEAECPPRDLPTAAPRTPQPLTCAESNDPLIAQACQQLYAKYQSWPAIPTLQQEAVLGGQRYHVATDLSTASPLRCTVLLLKRQKEGNSVLGDAPFSFSDNQGSMLIVLVLATVAATFLPVAVGLWLSSYCRSPTHPTNLPKPQHPPAAVGSGCQACDAGPVPTGSNGKA